MSGKSPHIWLFWLLIGEKNEESFNIWIKILVPRWHENLRLEIRFWWKICRNCRRHQGQRNPVDVYLRPPHKIPERNWKRRKNFWWKINSCSSCHKSMLNEHWKTLLAHRQHRHKPNVSRLQPWRNNPAHSFWRFFRNKRLQIGKSPLLHGRA